MEIVEPGLLLPQEKGKQHLEGVIVPGGFDTSPSLAGRDANDVCTATSYLREIAEILRRQEASRIESEKSKKRQGEIEKWHPLGKLTFNVTANASVLAIFIAALDAGFITYFHDLRTDRENSSSPTTASDKTILVFIYISLIFSLLSVCVNSVISTIQFAAFQYTENDDEDIEENMKAQFRLVTLALLGIILLVWPALTTVVVAILVLAWREEGLLVGGITTGVGGIAVITSLCVFLTWLWRSVLVPIREKQDTIADSSSQHTA